MIQSHTAVEIGESFTKRIIKTEIVHLDQFMADHKMEFRLCVLDRIYKIQVKPDNITETETTQIWTELFSSFLADYNAGLGARGKAT